MSNFLQLLTMLIHKSDRPRWLRETPVQSACQDLVNAATGCGATSTPLRIALASSVITIKSETLFFILLPPVNNRAIE